jgi:hypothetical protein
MLHLAGMLKRMGQLASYDYHYIHVTVARHALCDKGNTVEKTGRKGAVYRLDATRSSAKEICGRLLEYL